MSAYAQYPLRLVIAPAGCGKSTLLTKYALDAEQDTRFCAIPERCDTAVLHESIGHAMRAKTIPATYADLLALFGADSGRIDLIVDDADNCDEAALEELRSLVEDTGSNVSLTYSARSREALGANEWIARGVAAVCDAKQLAFDAVDTAQLAAAFGANVGDLDARRLAEDTDGWALAVASTVRIAAAENETLSRAYASWRERAASFLYDFVGAELERVKPDDAALFLSLMNRSTAASPMRLRALASRGLFIADRGGDDVRVYLPLYAGTRPVRTEPSSMTPPMHANMFREFSATIGGREIPWVRRRDQQIVKYLLLKPDGTASRLELAQVFWPETERHLATQSVRTACSTIRKAIASVVGYAQVDNYFRTSLDVKIDLSNVLCDVLRFRAHVKEGQAAVDRGDTDGAFHHFSAAEKLYAGGLLEFEPPEPWFAQHAAALSERYLMALETLCEINLELERIDDAQRFVARLCALAPERSATLRLQETLKRQRGTRVARTRFERGTVEHRKRMLESA